MSRHFLDNEFLKTVPVTNDLGFGLEDLSGLTPDQAKVVQTVLTAPVVDTDDDDDDDEIEVIEAEPVVPPEEHVVVCPPPSLNSSTEFWHDNVMAIESLTHIVSEAFQHQSVSIEELAVADSKGYFFTPGCPSPLTDKKWLERNVFSKEALEPHQVELVANNTHMLHTVKTSEFSQVVFDNLSEQWTTVKSQMMRRLEDMSKRTVLKAGFKAHYKEAGAQKVAQGVYAGAVLIGNLVAIVTQTNNLLAQGVDHSLAEVNKMLNNFTNTYQDVFYIRTMEIKHQGEVIFYTYAEHNEVGMRKDLFARDGETLHQLGWTNGSVTTMAKKLQDALDLLDGHIFKIVTHVAEDATTLTGKIIDPDAPDEFLRRTQTLMYLTSLMSAVSYLLYQVVNFGTAWCEECVYRLYN